MPITKRAKSKLPTFDQLATTKKPASSGRSSQFFPIRLANDQEVQFSAQWTVGIDYSSLVALDWIETHTPVEMQSVLNESVLVRYALAHLAYSLGCAEHPIPTVLQLAERDFGQAGLTLGTGLPEWADEPEPE